MLEMIRDVVYLAWERIKEAESKHPGRLSIPVPDLIKTLLLQSYFCASNTLAAGLVRIFKEKLGISKEFFYKTVERGYNPERVKGTLEEVFKILNECGNFKETVCSIDGTGDPTTMKLNYESKGRTQK